MSLKERKIREELEREIENNLEREIKEGMHGLAMKLHKLHLHRREKSESKITRQSSNQQNKQRRKIVSEVNINIKMEGGTTIEIKESRKEDRRIPNSNPNPNPKQVHNARKIKFDWTQSLRSGSNNSRIESKIEEKKSDKVGNSCATRKVALLELGWKY